MSEYLSETQRIRAADLNALVGAMRGKASELAEGFSGVPGSPWGELMNALMARGRSIMPGGSSYKNELKNVRLAREERYPGAYSVIDPVRKLARSMAAADDMVAMGSGMAAPIAYHGSKVANIRKFKPDKAGLSYFAYEPRVSADYGPHVAKYDVRPRHTLDLGGDPFDLSTVTSELRRAGREDIADRISRQAEPGERGLEQRLANFDLLRDPEIVSALKPSWDSFSFADAHNEWLTPPTLAVFPGEVPIRFKSKLRVNR